MEQNDPDYEQFQRKQDIYRNTQFYEKHLNQILAISETGTFKEGISSLRKKFHIPDNGFSPEVGITFGGEMEIAVRKLTRELNLDFTWADTIQSYVINNDFVLPEYTNFFDVVDLRKLTNHIILPNNPDDITDKDVSDNYLKMIADEFPIAILIPPNASERDIVDFIKKAYLNLILPAQTEYKNECVNISRYRRRNALVRDRDQFIYENRSLPRKKIVRLVSNKYGEALDYGHIGKIISIESKKRNL